jgi:glucokinase
MLRFGFDIGGTNIAAGVLDEQNRLIAKDSLKFPRGQGTPEAIETCARLYRSILDASGIADERIAGVGVAVPGSVDIRTGTVVDAHNLGFHHTPLKSLLTDRLQTPVALINDADAAALEKIAERRNR